MWQPGWDKAWGRMDKVCVWLSPFDVHLKLSTLLTGYTPIPKKKKKANSAKLLDTKSIYKNQFYFYIST